MSNHHTGKTLVLGAGNFGTCLAEHLAHEGRNVEIWARAPEVVEGINNHHKNPKYLSTITLAPSLRAINTIDIKEFGSLHAVVVAVPMQGMRDVLKPLAQYLSKSTLLICAVKGIETETGKLPLNLYDEIFGSELAKNTVVLSGPSFAIEVAQHLPTAVVAASRNITRAQAVQQLFHSSHFRVYTSEDPLGLEVAGALKNVVAIAAGACAGLGFQANSQAAIMTRGLAEITRMGVKMGANPLTLQGLGGVGDLFLTCSSSKSRNYSLGFKMGQGIELHAALASLGSVSEGYHTTKAAYALSKKFGVDTPIIDQVYGVLYESKPIKKAFMDLVNRDVGPELKL